MATDTAVRELPIIFSGEMVRAILEGRKTQTRRVIKPQPVYVRAIDDVPFQDLDGIREEILCPYGKSGDRLWVRETWAAHKCFETYPPRSIPHDGVSPSIYYKACDGSIRSTDPSRGCWRPSIHMPRWASRIDLEVLDLCIERVQEISEEDAKAEGCIPMASYTYNDGSPCYADSFRELWERIHGIDNPKSWYANPWVWAIEFQKA